MNNKDFDEIIRKKLESLNTEGSDDAWDLFKEKWNESNQVDDKDDLSTEDQDLDEKIKMDMQKLRIPFNSKHWIILKEQLELEALFKKKLFVAKSVELIVLAFLVLGILNLFPIQTKIYQIPLYDIPMVASVPVDKETAEIHQAREEARLANQSEFTNTVYNSTKQIVRKTVSAIESLPIIGKSSSASESKVNSSSSFRQIKSNLKDQRVLIKSDIEIPFIITPASNTSTKKTESHTSRELDEDLFAVYLPNDLKQLELPIRPMGFPDITLVGRMETKKQKENTYISFAIGPKMNLINSPFDPVYRIDPYNTINTNFNISAKIHKEIGPIELFAGLGYTNTSYEPLLVSELYEPKESQYNVVKLENIKFKTFNIPVGVHYDLINSGNYHLYATAGVDMNIIAESEFDIEDVPVGSSPRPFGPPPTSSSGNRPNSNADLSQKEFNRGVLAGGSLKDNLYASANVGFGMNWNLSFRSAIFFEPKYSHFISSQGIGPNEDKVHGVSVDFGFRFRL